MKENKTLGTGKLRKNKELYQQANQEKIWNPTNEQSIKMKLIDTLLQAILQVMREKRNSTEYQTEKDFTEHQIKWVEKGLY